MCWLMSRDCYNFESPRKHFSVPVYKFDGRVVRLQAPGMMSASGGLPPTYRIGLSSSGMSHMAAEVGPGRATSYAKPRVSHWRCGVRPLTLAPRLRHNFINQEHAYYC